MALTVFDAVGKFSADTSDLDQFIAKLERGIPDASGKAAAATRALKQAQDEFRQSIKAVSVEGGDTAQNMQRLADAEKNLTLASAAAKQEHAALRAELTQTTQSSGLMTQAANELTGKLTAMLGVIASVEGFKTLVEGTQKSILQLELLSEKTGIAIDQLAGIQHVSEAAGVSFDDVSTALVRLSRSQALALEGGQQQVDAFKRIGISVKELKSLSPEDLFFRVADAMANAKNHAEANASAFGLLGRGGAALIPIFQQNTEELRKMVDEAAKASGVTKEAGEAARDWEAQVAKITETFRALLIPVMEAVIPVIKSVETEGIALATVLRELGIGITGLYTISADAASGTARVFDDLVHGDFKQFASDVVALQKNAVNDLAKIGTDSKQQWETSVEALRDVWKSVNPTKPAIDDLSDLKDKADQSLQKYQAAFLAAQQSVGNAVMELIKQQAIQRVNIQEQGYSLENAATKAAFAEQLDELAKLELQKRALVAKAADDEYQLRLNVLKEQLAIAQAGGQKTLAEAQRIAAEIEALQFQHQAKIVDSWNKAMDALRKATSQPIPLVNEVPPNLEQIQNELTKAFDKAEQSAQDLGITLGFDLKQGLDRAYDAYNRLLEAEKKGGATQKDVQNGYIALVKAQLDFAKATGASEQAIARLQKQLDQLLGKETTNFSRFGRQSHTTLEQLIADLKSGVSGMQELEGFGVAAFDALSSSLQSAVASAIMGQESFGQAMERATAQALASLAAQALVKALFYTAEGFAALASFNYSGAAQFFEAAGIMGAVGAAAAVAGHALASASSSGSSTSSGGGTPAPSKDNPVAVSSGPSQGANITHVGTGGIATGRTLAMIGDDESGSSDASEAVLPLTNHRAMDMIAAAILPGFQRIISPSLLSRGTVVAATPSISGADYRLHSIGHRSPQKSPDIHITLHSDIPQFAKAVTKKVNNGEIKLLASNSIRVTKRS